MTITLSIGGAVLFALSIAIAIEIARLRSRSKVSQAFHSRHPRRLPLLEDRMRDAFTGPVTQYGEIFVSYMIWRQAHETRLELFSGDPWLRLNEFTRSIVVRHLWRALEALAKGAVVIVDAPAQQWSKEIDASFDDRGIDPWAGGRSAGSAGGAQFVKE
jgi:hypothetical protein